MQNDLNDIALHNSGCANDQKMKKLRQHMERDHLADQQAVAQWEEQMRMQAQLTNHPKLPPFPPPVTSQSELQPRAAPDVHAALREHDPAYRPSSTTQVLLVKPPPTTGRPIPKGFIGVQHRR